jgi:hypothetical protein
MVGMPMRNHGALDRADRVDVEAARLATQTGGDGHQDVLRAHAVYIGRSAAMFSRAMLSRHARA